MRYRALACDYDGTLAAHGALEEDTAAALERLRATGWGLVMVTGRELPELKQVCPRLDLFDWVVAENGALLHSPSTDMETLLAEPPPADFVAALRARDLRPLSVGRVVVATREPHGADVEAAIRALGLDLRIVLNKGAVMVLPAGVDKAFGLGAALTRMGLSPADVVAVGDGENDRAFLSFCGYGVAVANALPLLKAEADLVTAGEAGAGVIEIVQRILADDLP